MRLAQVSCLAFAVAVLVTLSAVEGTLRAAAPDAVDSLWVNPVDLEQRDLFRGPADGGPTPDPDAPFAFVARDTSGRSPGYDVRDANGVVWSVKLGPEAQAEVVAQRLLYGRSDSISRPRITFRPGR